MKITSNKLGSLEEIVKFLDVEEKRLKKQLDDELADSLFDVFKNGANEQRTKLKSELRCILKLKKMIVVNKAIIDVVRVDDLQEMLDEHDIDATATIKHAVRIAHQIDRMISKQDMSWFAFDSWLTEMRDNHD